MDRYQWSSLRKHNKARETANDIACTGDRYQCCCRACGLYRHQHWGLRPLSTSEESSRARRKKNTGAGYLPSAITWIYIRVYPVRLIQSGVIPDSTLQKLQLYSLAMTLPVKMKKMMSGIYRLAEAIRDPGPGHLGRLILTGIVLIRTWPGPLSLSMMAHSGMIK